MKKTMAILSAIMAVLVILPTATCEKESKNPTEPATFVSAEPTAPVSAEPTALSEPILVWGDEFEGYSLDFEKWHAMIGTGPEENYPERWGNMEEQYYRSENAQVKDGNLIINIKKENFENMGYTSARLTTSGLFAFTYGRIEARIKLPAGMDGIWPAFWLLPDGEPDSWKYGTWAASGEIDVMESKSRKPYEISSAVHFGAQWPNNTYISGSYKFPAGESVSEWHIYALERYEDKMIWYVDGEEYFRAEDWYSIVNDKIIGPPEPFDQPFCIIINGAVGGNFDGGITPGEDFTSAEILVDWIRVYQ